MTIRDTPMYDRVSDILGDVKAYSAMEDLSHEGMLRAAVRFGYMRGWRDAKDENRWTS